MTSRVTVRLADGHEYEFKHVKSVGIMEPGVFVLLSPRGERMAHFPLMHVAAIIEPDKDSDIVIAQVA